MVIKSDVIYPFHITAVARCKLKAKQFYLTVSSAIQCECCIYVRALYSSFFSILKKHDAIHSNVSMEWKSSQCVWRCKWNGFSKLIRDAYKLNSNITDIYTCVQCGSGRATAWSSLSVCFLGIAPSLIASRKVNKCHWTYMTSSWFNNILCKIFHQPSTLIVCMCCICVRIP